MFEINLTDAVSSKYKQTSPSNTEASASALNSVFQSSSAKANSNTKSIKENSALPDQEKIKKAEDKARKELNSDLEFKNNAKPVITSLKVPFDAALNKMQFITDAFVTNVSKLFLELGDLDPSSPEAKNRATAIAQEVKELKAKAKIELENLSNVVFAMEEVSQILTDKYGTKANNVPLVKIIDTLNKMVESSSTAAPEDVSSQVQKLLEDFKKEENGKDKKQGNPKLHKFGVFSASLGAPSDKV